MNYEELQADYDRRANDKQDWYNGGYWTDIDSGTNYLGTLNYLKDQQQHDEEEWKPLKAVWNGFYKQAGRGLVGNMQMRLDSDIARLQEEHPEVATIDSTKIAQSYLNNPQATAFNLTPYQIKADSTASQVAYGFLEGAGQLASQAIVSGLTGAWGGAIFMGSQIAGSQYTDLRAQGVDADRALVAVLANAAIQSPMEKIGFGRIIKLPKGNSLRDKALQILESAVTEGVTEGLQELPEQFTDIWAKNEGLDALGITEEWSKNKEENIKDMVFSGVIGGLLGGGASGLNMGARSAWNIIGRKLEEKTNAAMVESAEQNAEQIKADGINPQRAAEEIDKRKPEGVSVDAAVLRQAYGQTAGELRKVADSLGVTEEEINEAAANGLDIGVTRGKLTATMASVNGFAQTVHDHISFNDGASSINYAEMQKDLTAAYEAGEQAAGELDTELDNIIASAKEAGMAQPQAEGLRTLLESRAMIANPENPAAWLKKHGLRFANEGKRKPGKGLYQNGKLNKEGFYSTNITGNELGSYKDISDLRNKALDFYKNNLQGTSVHNAVLGDIRLGKGFTENDVYFSGKGRKEMAHTSAKIEKLLAVKYLGNILANSNFVTEAASAKEKHNGEHFYYIHSAVNVGGRKQYVVVNVIQRRGGELFYYNHNVFNENEYKKIEDALKPSSSAVSSAVQNLDEQSSFANSVSQKGQVYKQQRIVEGKNNTKGMIEPLSESAENRLAADEKAFGDSVDALMKNALASGKPIKVMTTPLALKAAGAPLLPVEIEYENLHKILRGKHSKDMSASIVKQLPRALTDPLMIFKSYDGKNGEKRMVVAVDLKDNKGATIVVPFELKQNSASNTYQLNAIKSAYGKTDNKTGDPSYNYFKKQIESGNVIYLNKKRTAVWNLSAGLYLPMDGSTEGPTLSGYNNQQKSATGSSIIEDIITQHNKDYKDENDLQALQNEYPGYYQTAYHGTPHSFEQFDLGAIGSGVGLQAHGWGLYFTADKKVAEEYKEFTGGKGFVYEADIPENDVLLDAGKFFGEQPAKVKRAINKIIENLSDEELENFDDVGSLGRAKVIRSIKECLADSYGENIYGTIYDLISDGNKGRDTSLLLNKYGVKGIAYEDKGKRNFVVFDDKAISIINRYNQENNGIPKGNIMPQEDGRYIVSLFEHADASTVIHETGHYFFDTFMIDSAAPDADARMKRDRQRLLDYVGMTEEQWNTADLEGRRAAHERMAEAFETYIMEGKAPSRNLRSLFNRFSKWLKAIYEKYVRSNNAAELTPEVRDVFDHWLAADMDIQQAAKAEGILGKLPDAITKNLSDKSRQWLEDKITNAKDEAVNMLTKEYMRNFTPERRKAIAEFKAQITPDIEKQVAEVQVNRARDAIADRFAREHIKRFKFEAYDVLTVKQKMFLAANPNVIARKYKNALDPEYRSMQEYLYELNKEIDDRLNPIIEELKNGYGHGVEDFWIDTETGQEADVSGLTKEERTGYQYKRMRRSLNAPWYQNWYKDKGHTPTKAELRELACDLYAGVDKYGFYADMNLFSSAQEAAEFDALSAERKAEIDQLIADRDAVKGDEDYKKLKQRSMLSDEDIVSFKRIADEFGYDSGDAMADAIINEPSAQKMVRDRVEQAVNARFPDAAKERELAEAATMEALYNDESGMVIALEQQLIEDAAYEVAAKDRSSKAREALAVARKAQTEREAEAAMRKLTMADALRASKFAMAERRAAAKAQKAIKKGNMEEAAEYKRQQAIAHAMVRKSVKLKQEVERNRKFIRKLRTMKKENFGTEQHLNQIGAFLARMGLVRKDYNPNNKTQTLQQYLTEMREKLGDMVVSADDDWPSFILDESYDLRDSNGMSIEQYGSVVKMLKQLRNIAKQDTQMELEGKAIFAKENKEIVLAELDNMDTVYKPEPGESDKPSWLKRLSWGRLNADTLFEKMDGWKQGFFSKAWYGLLKHCADREAAITMDFEERNAAAKKAWLPDRKARKDAAEKRHYDELGASVDKFTLVQMLCNLGNEGNARRICETPPLGFEGSKLWVRPNEQISKDAAFEQTRENLLAFLGKVLTKADIEYAQAKTDNCDRYWSQLAEVNLRTKGFEPERVEATPAVLTLENGEMVKFKGGYFPLVRDGRNGSRPQNVNALAATDENPAGNISTMTTNSGSSKARTGAAYPVSLIADAEMVTMRNTIHDICYREAMIYFRKNINDPEIFAKLKSKMGVEGTRVFREMLEKCANPYSNAGMDFAEDTVARAASWLRRKTVNATIALNFKIALQNFGNVFLYGNTVDGFTYSDVLTTIPNMLKLTPAHYRQSRATVFAKSPFMRERAKLPDVTIRDVQASGRLSGLEQWGLDWGAMLLERTDNLTAIPIWLKAYNKQIQQGASEQAAVDFADTVIRRTLGSSRVQDVASIQRGGPMYKLFTAFQGFFNTQFNQWYREAHIDATMFSKGERWEAFKRASAFLVSKLLLACLANVFLGGDGDPLEEDKKGWKKITKELMTYPISVVGGPEGVIANAVVQKAFDMENYGYKMSIVQNTIEKGISFGYKSGRVLRGEAETDALYEPAAEMLAVMLGLPLQISRTGFNAVDIFRGEMEFEMQDIIKRRPKSER